MQIHLFEDSNAPKINSIVNVASVPQRSPFRYAGGKTWLIPRIRQWLKAHGGSDKKLIEPFAGGGIVSLTAAFENLVDHVTMIELDEDVAAVWEVVTNGGADWLADRIINFDLTTDNVNQVIAEAGKSVRDRAFATIVRNRVNHGGILAEGSGFLKHGENGKGIRSRWYPDTLKKRILGIGYVSHKITFIQDDGFKVCEQHVNRDDAVYFIDPPYVKAGRRLYRYSEIDHEALFKLAARLKGNFLMTYDNNDYIEGLAARHGFETREIPMKNTHNAEMTELLISRDFSWF